MTINEPFVLITYTTGFGSVPPTTSDFLRNNHLNLKGVAVSGNRNWGTGYAKAAELISNQYSVPILHRFELSGTKNDIEVFTERLREING